MSGDGDADKLRSLKAAQVRRLYDSSAVTLAATLFNGAVLVLVQWWTVSRMVLLGWLAVLLAIAASRAFIGLRFAKAQLEDSDMPLWGRRFTVGAAAAGVVWGAAGLLIFPLHSEMHQVFTAFVIGGMVAGATATLSVVRLAFFLFVLPAALPVIFRSLLVGDGPHMAMALLMSVFLVVMVVTSTRIGNEIVRVLKLRDENSDLIKKLTEENDIRRAVEDELLIHHNRLESLVEERTAELTEANRELENAIEEQRITESALKDSEEKYRLLFDHANDGILVLQDRAVKFANPSALRLTGFTEEAITSADFTQFIHPDDCEVLLSRYERRLAGEIVSDSHTFRVRTKTGEDRWTQINSVRVVWGGRPAVLTFMRDITEQRQLESQFQVAQKIEAVGTLAGGIAHDFNNLLMGMQGNVSLMLADMPADHPDRPRMLQVEECVESGASLAQQLLGFARGGTHEDRPLDLNAVIDATLGMFVPTHKEVVVVREYAASLPSVRGDYHQLQQALLNLCINAWQAMPDGGTLTVSTRKVSLDQRHAGPLMVHPGDFVRVTLTDTGIGMDKETQLKIFDPFFTTKEMGRGAGLGLASVYGIVRNHDGVVIVDSEPGQGARFRIYLPATDQEVAPATEQKGRSTDGAGTILLVDDEAMILNVGSAMLERLGYEVIRANGGREAIELFEKRHADIRLVVLDMIMPEVGGRQTFGALRKIDPSAQILLSSGYSQEGQAEELLQAGCCGFLQKPFKLQALSAKLCEVLEEPHAKI